MKQILVYNDDGVSKSSFHNLFDALSRLERFQIKAVTHRFFLSDAWEEKTALVAFPGGRDLPYHLKLKGEGNRRIKNFVHQGGRYLGICAGAYYGASEIEFEKGGKLEICALRELAFFPGKAIGPAYGNGSFSYDSEQGARAAFISWEKGLSSIYYNGGCYFENAHDAEIIARYADLPDTPAAVIYCPCGDGAALLSGVHPEHDHKSPFFHHLMNRILHI